MSSEVVNAFAVSGCSYPALLCNSSPVPSRSRVLRLRQQFQDYDSADAYDTNAASAAELSLDSARRNYVVAAKQSAARATCMRSPN
jgi:hypothetical protein